MINGPHAIPRSYLLDSEIPLLVLLLDRFFNDYLDDPRTRHVFTGHDLSTEDIWRLFKTYSYLYALAKLPNNVWTPEDLSGELTVILGPHDD